jgi:hypothetical protein
MECNVSDAFCSQKKQLKRWDSLRVVNRTVSSIGSRVVGSMRGARSKPATVRGSTKAATVSKGTAKAAVIAPVAFKSQLFGVALHVLMERQQQAAQAVKSDENQRGAGMCVPILVNKLVEHLQVRGCKEEGVLRLAASREDTEKLKQQLEHDVTAPDLYATSIHVIGDVLKHFIRELPNSLFDASKWDRWMAIAEVEKAEERAKQCKGLLLELEHSNRAFITVLFHLMALMVQKKKLTKMDAVNLSRVMAPNLLRDPDPVREYSAIPKVSIIVETMITHYAVVFREMDLQYRIVNTINYRKAAQSRPSKKGAVAAMRSAPPPPPAAKASATAALAPPLKKQRSEMAVDKAQVPPLKRSKTESFRK